VEEEVQVTKDNNIRVDEDELVVVSQLPEAKLRIVVLVVGALLSPRVSDPFYDPEFPPGRL